jgi:hypothetical protein
LEAIMPSPVFDWIVRTAMLAMAGLVTLSILGAIAAMTNDPGTRFAAPRDRALIQGEPAEEREAARAAPPAGEEKAATTAPSPAGEGAVLAVAPPPAEDKVERWLEAIAYALLALAGIGALGVLMLWSILRELRRVGDQRSR